MCGIFAILNSVNDVTEVAYQKSKLLKHRGPEHSGIYSQTINNITNVICHERLSIVDLHNQNQPLINDDYAVVANGEIYNHHNLRNELSITQSHSDCEIILHLCEYDKIMFMNKLDGMFSFVLINKTTNDFIIARDHVGITSLYYGYKKNITSTDRLNDCAMYVSSEMKAITDCDTVFIFPPGYYYDSKIDSFVQWYNPQWCHNPLHDYKLACNSIRLQLEKSVVDRLMSDVPYAVLLSGGLDSSLIAAIAAKHNLNLQTFTIGLQDSSDIKAAEIVSKYLHTNHTCFNFTVEQGINVIPDIIYYLETYDITTIRASIPMYLMAKSIKALNIKMVLSGEGSDEIFGGYLYFHKAPTSADLHDETIRKIQSLHYYDCLRAHKATLAHGVELRVPFLSVDFLNTAMSINPEYKMINKSTNFIEKHILRKAFEGYLPDEILYRQKEQFSDGVGHSWIDKLTDFTEAQVTDNQMLASNTTFLVNTPVTKEGYYYRSIFESIFGNKFSQLIPYGPSAACSSSIAFKWDNTWKNDPSGRSVIIKN